MKTHLMPLIGTVVVSVFLTMDRADGARVSWDVDPAVSYIRLTVPDQAVNVTNVGNVTVRLRDPGSSTAWTDAGGRRAAVDGTLSTDYTDPATITFIGGAHNLYALEQTNLRPNPAHWDPVGLSYTNTGTAPAALGARVRGTYLILTFDAAFLALRNVRLDVASEAVTLTAGAFPGNQTEFGIISAVGDVDGLELPLDFGQPVPDVLGGELDPIVATNSLGGLIEDLGGKNRKLTLNIETTISIDLQGILLSGSATGQIVAYGTIPEVPPLSISAGASQTVVITWPVSATGFVLEQTAALGTANWTPVTTPPVVVGDENRVTLSSSTGIAFYRLRSQ